jgi:hypothetical protein
MSYRCVNDFWVECSDNQRWDLEHKKIQENNPNNASCIMNYKCELDKGTCGFNKSLQQAKSSVEVASKPVEVTTKEDTLFNFQSNPKADVGKGSLCNQLAPKESKPRQTKKQIQTLTALPGFEELIKKDNNTKAKLKAKFIVPPFSVLDTKQGYWQDRKRQWISLGIKSEIGRGENTLDLSATAKLEHPLSEEEKEEWNKSRRESPKNQALTFGLRIDDRDSNNPDKGYTKQGKAKARSYKQNLLNKIMQENGGAGYETGTSIFDPVLCELMYKWFCPQQGNILDCFSGGSVRGVVANYLGYKYNGIDLSDKQIEANYAQAKEIVPDNIPNWIIGNSLDSDKLLPQDFQADFLFSCPPYHDLEVYSDDMEDLSNMTWQAFKDTYAQIIAKAILRLKQNRFACFVVSEIRDEKGYYKGFVPYTIEAFYKGGMRFYNELILVNVVGSLPVRVNNQMTNRKIGRMHQNILIFYKGDPDCIPSNFNSIDTDM